MKEFLKSILLVVLTFSTITMTYWIFSDSKISVADVEETSEPIDLIDYIRPQNYIFSFGDLFIKLYDDTYENIEVRKAYEASLTSFLSAETDLQIAHIEEKTWQEDTQKRSIQVNYPLPIPINDFLEIYHFSMNEKSDVGDVHVSSVLFLLNHDEYIYLYDESKDQYHKLYYETADLSAEVWVTDLFEAVDLKKSNDDGYRTMESRYNFLKAGLVEYNLETPNLLLTPVSTNITYPKYNVIQEVNIGSGNSKQVEAIAASVFGDELDFVKKSVYSDTSTIYILGYGEKIFKIDNDGTLEFTVKPDESSQKKTIEFLDGLRISIEHIDRLGIPSETMYLSGYFQSETNASIETVYLFNYSKNGIPFYDPNTQTGDLIEVRFSNESLVKVKKNAPIIINEELSNFQSVKSFKSIIQRNRISFEKAFENEMLDQEVAKEDLLQMALHNMETLSLKYYLKEDTLIPVWYIKIEKTHYFIDLTSGLVLNQYSD